MGGSMGVPPPQHPRPRLDADCFQGKINTGLVVRVACLSGVTRNHATTKIDAPANLSFLAQNPCSLSAILENWFQEKVSIQWC